MNIFLIQLFILIIIFFFGASLGSFFSVLIYRLKHNKKGILTGRSQCPFCHKNITAQDLIPLVSFILNQGKCRHCKKKISRHYFYLEASTGITAILSAQVFPFHEVTTLHNVLGFTLYTLIASTLVGIAFFDILYTQIPDQFNLAGMILALISVVALGTPTPLSILIALLIIICFFGGQIVASKGAWLGMGDFILGIFMALLLGWEKLLLALILAYFSGAFISLGLIAFKKASRKTLIPFGPFLVAGTLIALLFGDELIYWYTHSTFLYF